MTTTETVAVEIDAALMERAPARVPPERRLSDRGTAQHALAMLRCMHLTGNSFTAIMQVDSPMRTPVACC
jgi:hypothetical protein